MNDKASPTIDGHESGGGVDISWIMQAAKHDEPLPPPAKESRRKKKQPKHGSKAAVPKAHGEGAKVSTGTQVEGVEKTSSTHESEAVRASGKAALRKKHRNMDCAKGNGAQSGDGDGPKVGSKAAVPSHDGSAMPKKNKWNASAKKTRHAEGGKEGESKQESSSSAAMPVHIHTKPALPKKKKKNGGKKINAAQMKSEEETGSTEENHEAVPILTKPVVHKKKKGNSKKKEPAEVPVPPGCSHPSVDKNQHDHGHAKGNAAQMQTGKEEESTDEGKAAVPIHTKPVLYKKKKKNGTAKSHVPRMQMGKETEDPDEGRAEVPPRQSTPVLRKPVLHKKQNSNSANSNVAQMQIGKSTYSADEGPVEDPPRQSKPVVHKKQNSNGSVAFGKEKESTDDSDGQVPRSSKPVRLEKNGHNGSAIHVLQKKSRKKEGATDESTVVVLRSRGQAVILKKNGNGGSTTPKEPPETTLLKRRLCEAEVDLHKERNTREMLENRVRSLDRELTLVKEKLGGDKSYCISSLHEELEGERQLRASAQNDLAKCNETVSKGQEEMTSMARQVQAEKEATRAVEGKLRAAKDDLQAERARQAPLEAELGLERRKNKDLQRRLQYEAAASIAIRMELRALKGKADAATKLAEELTRQRSASEEAHSEVEETARAPLALHDTTDAERDRLLRRLRKELYDSKAKLKYERQKNELARPKHERQKHEPAVRLQKKCPQRSLSDWVRVAPTNRAQHAGLIPILPAPSATSMPPPIETSLPGSSRTETVSSSSTETTSPPSASTETSPPPAAHESLFHFEDDDTSVAGDAALEPLHDELTFLGSAYDPDELVIEGKRVTHFIELATWYDADTVSIAIAVEIPEGYPAAGVLSVTASIRGASCSHALRKCAVDALPLLEEICAMEARANEGKESIHPIFSVASGWAHTDWYNLLSKELSIADDVQEDFEGASTEICVALIHTHHIVEADKMQIQSIKKHASKLSLGGFLKIGKPGLILVEGDPADCDQFLDALAQSKKVFHSSTFKVGGRALRKVSDAEDRCLPRKMGQLEHKGGMDELSGACEELGLLQALRDIIS